MDGDNDGGRGHVSRVSLCAQMRRGDIIHHLHSTFSEQKLGVYAPILHAIQC